MLKKAFLEGAEDSLREYGILPKKEPSLLRKALPYVAGLGAAGLGYKFLRSPSFSKIPAMRKLQELAGRKGFHRLVDVRDVPLQPGASLVQQRIPHWLMPKADPITGKMNWLNRAKFWLQEGSDAIPVAETAAGKMVIPDHAKNIEGVVAGRHEGAYGSKAQTPASLIHGGTDIEGPLSTQKILTQLGQSGKAVEADLLQQHAPGSSPYTRTDVGTIGKGLPIDTLANRLNSAEELRRRLLNAHGADNDFILKPSMGYGSSGTFPKSTHNWADQLKQFEEHITDPVHAQALKKIESIGGTDLAHYLKKHNIAEGHTLHQALRDPSSVISQNLIKNRLGEWRVHTLAGEAPEHLMAPRSVKTIGEVARLAPTYANLGKLKTRDLKAFIEDVMSKLPEKYRQGNFGIDVMPYREANGKISFKIIELNPTEAASHMGEGGGSGYLVPNMVPFAGHLHSRAATGRHTPLIAGLGGLAAASAVGGLTDKATPDDAL